MAEDAKDILGYTAYDDQESATANAITTTIPWSLSLNAPMLLDQWSLLPYPSSFETAFSHHHPSNMLSPTPADVHQRRQQSQRHISYIDPLTTAATSSNSTTNMTFDQSALQYLGSGQHQTEASNDGATTTVPSDTFFDAGAYLQSHPGDMAFDWTEFTTTTDMMPFQPSRVNQLSDSPFYSQPMNETVSAAEQMSHTSPLAACAPVQTPIHTPLAPEIGRFAVEHHSPDSLKMDDGIASSPGSARSGETYAVSDP
ncbi:hypothetical protein KEM54_000361, partial [Ascosphaera aggregata]